MRELQNVIEHVAVLVEPDQLIEPTDIPMYEDSEAAPERMPAAQLRRAVPRCEGSGDCPVRARLSRAAGWSRRGNMSKAARQANVDRTTLYRLMEKHGLQRDDRSE
ncbi:MAG: hypothetical protein IPO52_14455 [Gemmatimonadetes bacterium]|nr:hypothetical protein [Gemmatimonadota bacterium]